MKSMQKEKGFTIIEVVLVLAIAGLIFLIVFLAVPALQRSQRDQARKSDVGRVIAAVQDWKSNHRGQLPTAADMAASGSFYKGLTNGSTFQDPSGGDYVFVNSTGDPTNTTDGKIFYQAGGAAASCSTSGDDFGTTGGGRNFAILMKLESGSDYCQSN